MEATPEGPFGSCRDDCDWVAGQKLLVDMSRDEKAFVGELRHDLKSALRTLGRPSYDKIVVRPNHRADAGIIQVANMFAGEIRRLKGEVPNVCAHRVHNYLN